MKKPSIKTPAVLAVLALGACTAGQTGPPNVNVPSNPLSGKLQFAVGSANIYGTHAGLNVIVTFRRGPAAGPRPATAQHFVPRTPTIYPADGGRRVAQHARRVQVTVEDWSDGRPRETQAQVRHGGDARRILRALRPAVDVRRLGRGLRSPGCSGITWSVGSASVGSTGVSTVGSCTIPTGRPVYSSSKPRPERARFVLGGRAAGLRPRPRRQGHPRRDRLRSVGARREHGPTSSRASRRRPEPTVRPCSSRASNEMELGTVKASTTMNSTALLPLCPS